ncbi:hypothetical protein [Cellulomonas xiejunii]|uniref:Flp pilus-assembly TadG-like N-terminal domain-containing protein n=1 Tax=Cellulomonas xiejunii TaxID=2968083 RepID=A0ABY5KTQ2_9CELL|nr:hypothetical protein [Cellulomonas xiejunii]MCC2314817.1 hypothetical protein [Cellulomonas xiejunii]MCC2323099.1 hypothetical protein [Cellulomonas xiejunii]UUI73589.1 hypothetical protein NP048_09260 [Cellulomonas xiejunii]
MSRAIARRLAHSGRDRGSALVSAVAIALIGLALASVVVASSIQGARDSGEDRARTAEMHTAEGVVDAVFAELEVGTPCQWPATGSHAGGTSPGGTQATATIAYYDEHDALLPCAAGVVTGTPASAVVTGVATGAGTDVKRAVQTKVNLTPLTIDGRGAAIFAASSILSTNGFTLDTALPDTAVDVWVDSGDVNCNSNVKIDGNLIVVEGTTEISNNCHITQDLWSKKKLTVHEQQGAGLRTVGQDTYVAADATLAGGSKYGRDVIIAGAMTTWGTGPQVAGTTRTGVGAGALPQYVKVGLPEVNYIPSDWVGFDNAGNRAQAYKDWVTSNAVANGAPTWSEMYMPAGNKCTVAGADYSLKGPLVGPTVATVFDTRFCPTTTFQGGLNIKLRADMVIFANNFYATGNFTITSADGDPHQVWIIVPDPDVTPNGVAECNKTVGPNRSGDIKFDSGTNITAPITFFGYTPCTIDTNNTMSLYGQLYGKDVKLRNALKVRYVPIGIPGVDLASTSPVSSSGVRVDVVYKREVKAP